MKTWIVVLSLLIVMINGCDSGSNNSNDSSSSSSSMSAGVSSSSSSSEGIVSYGTLIGIVYDTDSGATLGGVSISVGDKSLVSNDQGYFVIDQLIESNEAVVKFAKEGYVLTSEIVTIRKGANSDINVYMRKLSDPITLDSTNGGTVQNGNAAVTIKGGDLIDENAQPYHGTAHINLTPFDPTTESGREAFPGEFEGIKLDGTVEPLLSYGYVDITVTDGNNHHLQLKNGAKAQISIPIPASLQADAPDTMPLWWFNPDDGKWHEVGVMTRNGGLYNGEIEHFSIYNSDVGYTRSYVKGRLVDCNTGYPVTCGRIDIVGVSPRNCWKSGETCTPSNGLFEVPVDANAVADIFGSKSGIKSSTSRINTLPVGETLNLGDICINNPSARITLTWNKNPEDLDAHLTFDGPAGREMLYYAGEASDNSAVLDTDDQDGWGPEIITIYTLHDGVYRYSVHHFDGTDTIATGGTRLNMVVDINGNGLTNIYGLTPPTTTYNGVNDVWIAWDIYVQYGKITDIKTVNQVLHDINDDDIAAFSPQ